MFARQFEDEEEDSPVSALVEKGEAEYAFDGFDIEFSEKVALIPLTPHRSRSDAQTGSGRNGESLPVAVR